MLGVRVSKAAAHNPEARYTSLCGTNRQWSVSALAISRRHNVVGRMEDLYVRNPGWLIVGERRHTARQHERTHKKVASEP